ncbi:MAG TPA: hypothetical protein VMW69_13770 [Spirochaetia bacterium]|nr:hypothetical protein [Spirochaetia bacterium]
MFKFVPPVLLLLLSHAPFLAADGETNPLDLLKGEALAVNIVARVMESGHVSVWNMESRKITISGRGVQIRLEGDNVLVLAHLIPYLNDDNSILLVALGQVWAPAADRKGYKYYSTMKSLPVTAGEKVFFFPFGMAVDQKANVYTIELEIQVVPYSTSQKNTTKK